MDDDATRVRGRERLAARPRTRSRRLSYAESAVEQNTEVARRLLQGEELLTPVELERADKQLAIWRRHRTLEEQRERDAKWITAIDRVHVTRAWINTILLLSVAICVIVGLISGSIQRVSMDVWHYVTTYRL